MGPQGFGQLRTSGVRHRDEVVDGLGVEYLAADSRPHHRRANTLAGGVDGSCGTSRASANDEHVVRIALGQVLLGSLSGVGVETFEDLGHVHAARAPVLAIQVDGRHRGDALGLHLVGVGATLDGGVMDVRVEDGHRVEGLNHRRAVLAGQRHVGDEVVLPLDCPHRVDEGLLLFDRVATDLEQGQHQGGELVAHRQTGEADVALGAWRGDGERRGPLVVDGVTDAHLVRQGSDLGEQLVHLGRFRCLGGVVSPVGGGHQDDGLTHHLEVGLELGGQGVVKHDSPGWGSRGIWTCRSGDPSQGRSPLRQVLGSELRSCRRGRSTGRGCQLPLPTWRGRPRLGGCRRTGRP